ncbi:MAG: hypothetical protein IJZ42_13610 [Lachnospiraceae bacterium]|nr:hypothetical protein [Lachnospiraceae bacterium]
MRCFLGLRVVLDYGMRVIAPDEAVKAVEGYCASVGRCITDIRLASDRKQAAKRQMKNR